MKRCTLVAFALVTACGGPSSPNLVPQLPSDGNANTRGLADGRGDRAKDPWAGRTDLIQAPAPKEPSALGLPKVDRFKLKSGLQVLVIEDRTLPVVAMRLAIKAGRKEEDRAMVGIADLAAGMLDKGTKTRTAPQIADAIDFSGGGLSASSDFDGTYVSCQVLADALDTCLTLLPDVVVRPTFAEAELPTVRDNLLATVRARRDDAGQLASAHFANELWGDDHPRGWVMSESSLRAIGRKELQAWHATWFRPKNALLVVAGQVDAQSLKPKLERAFAGWQSAATPERVAAKTPELSGLRVRLVDKPDQTQAHIRVGHFGLRVSDPDFYDTMVVNYTLGGGAFSSRLMKVVRSEAGKTYGATSTFHKDPTRGALWMSTFTRTSETRATIELLLQELSKMAKDGPDDKEVAAAIANLAGSYSTSFQSAAAFASALLGAELAGFGPDYVRDFALKIGAVTPESAQAAARRRLDPENLAIVVVGPAKAIGPQLEKAGWKYEVVSAAEPVTGYERDAAAKAATAPSAADAARATAILDRALATKGGDKLSKIRGFRLEAKANLSLASQTNQLQMVRTMLRPDRLQLRMEMAGGTQVVTLAGNKGWVMQEFGPDSSRVADIEDKDLRAAKSQLWRDQELVLLRHKEAGTVAKVVETTPKHDVIELTRGTWAVRLFIDRKTGLLDRMVYQENGESSVEEYSDYRPVAGIQVAFRRKTTQTLMDQPATFDIEVTKMTFDPQVPPSVFAKPAGTTPKP